MKTKTHVMETTLESSRIDIYYSKVVIGGKVGTLEWNFPEIVSNPAYPAGVDSVDFDAGKVEVVLARGFPK
jgi:hypothetical protein